MNKKNSNKSFGILFFLVFLFLTVWSILNKNGFEYIFVVFSTIFLILGLLNSKILTPFNIIWVKFGELLGKIIAPIIMGIIYFLIITPIGLFLRLIGKDILNLKFNKNKSYWIDRQNNIGPMNKQY